MKALGLQVKKIDPEAAKELEELDFRESKS